MTAQTFFHRTTTANAHAILAHGFSDATGTYLTGQEHSGVWLSDVALGENEGACGEVLLAVDLNLELVKPFEWVEKGKPYREFPVPANVINAHAAVRLVMEED